MSATSGMDIANGTEEVVKEVARPFAVLTKNPNEMAKELKRLKKLLVFVKPQERGRRGSVDVSDNGILGVNVGACPLGGRAFLPAIGKANFPVPCAINSERRLRWLVTFLLGLATTVQWTT